MATTQRKLTTILSADVEGYSRLMGADEEGTFATLKASHDAVARHIAQYHGRVVNTWGDALIAEFPSVVSAVRAAIDAQGELAERNAGKSAERQMLYRIGINLGDVIADGDDIYGDGVNIAARLQSEAPPGGILISNTVYDQVRNKLIVGFEFLGNLDVKNIEESVPAFSVRVGGVDRAVQPAAQSGGQGGAPAPSRLSGFGRNPERTRPSEPRARASAPEGGRARRGWGGFSLARQLRLLGIAGAALVAINLLASPDVFWARWPLLAFAALIGLSWAGGLGRYRFPAALAVAGAFVATVNLFTWEGQFWAVWPLLAFVVIGAVRWGFWGR